MRIDYLGAVFIAAGVSLLLIWVSLAGKDFDWWSAQTIWMVGGSVALLVAGVITELVVKEPIIPLGLFKNRTFTLAVIASISVGVAMFGTSVFLGQYMQLARGATPTESGLLTLPMIFGLLLSSMIVGNLISRFGKWKAYMVVGSILLTVGLYLMSTIEYDTNYVVVSVYGYFLDSTTDFFVLAGLVGLVQGGTQALSRSLFASMIPRDRSSEFFGLFAVFEKFAGIVGPAIFAAAQTAFGSSRPAVLSIIAFFLLGGFLLTRVDVAEGRKLASAAGGTDDR